MFVSEQAISLIIKTSKPNIFLSSVDMLLFIEENKLDYCDRSDIEAAAWTNDDRIIPNTADGVEHYKQTMNRLFDKVDWSRVVLVCLRQPSFSYP